MNLTPEFMKKMGSGVNPEDQECVFGYNYFVDKYNSNLDLINSNNGIFSLENAIKILQQDVEDGNIEKEIGNRFILWLTRLKNKPEAIELQDTCIYHQEYNIFHTTNKILSTDNFETAKKFIDNEVNKNKNIFELVIVNKVRTNISGKVLFRVNDESEIVNGYEYIIFDPNTGINTSFEFGETGEIIKQEIERLYEQELVFIKSKYSIKQKIQDSHEGYVAWKDVTYAS